MDPRYKSRFNEKILAKALGQYGVTAEAAQEQDGFESFIYAFSRDGEDFILRIGHSHRRSANLVHGEADWINYLRRGGASVAPTVESLQGNLVEPLDDGHGEQFLATAFRRASGQPPRHEMITPALFENYGALLGGLHALTCNYQPSNPAWTRMQWNDPILLDAEAYLPETETIALERYRELHRHLNTLPRDRDYGLIHQDAHPGNFFVDEQDQITLFDFDDCCYSWFANDIAIVLFYVAMGEPDPGAFTQTFLTHFFRGYRREYHLDPAWLVEIPNFLKLREMDLYAVIHRSFDVNNLTDRWVARYMRGRKERIEAGVPYIDFDFSALANELL